MSGRHGKTGGQRMTQSCDVCRKRKIKCDAARPSCSNCDKLGVACQTLRPTRRRGRKSSRPTAALSQESPQTEPRHEPSPRESDGLPLTFEADEAVDTIFAGHLNATGDGNGAIFSLSPPQQRQSVQDLEYNGQSPADASVGASNIDDRCHGLATRQPDLHPRSSPAVTRSPNVASHLDPLFESLVTNLSASGIAQHACSYMRTCVDLYFEHIYPTYPVIHRPSVLAAIEQFEVPDQRLDHKSFSLVTGACAYLLAVLPETVSSAPWAVGEAFYQASKQSLEHYAEDDIEHPDHTSIAIRMFHSGWIHAAGKTRVSWYVLGECIRIAQSMCLHDEASYERMPHLEAQLCRRVFWTLFTGDKSAAVLGGHPVCMASWLFNGGITASYPEDFPEQDIIYFVSPKGVQQQMSLITGFKANQALWRAAEALLLTQSNSLYAEKTAVSTEDGTSQNGSKLAKLLLNFRTCLDGIPSVLRFHDTLASSVDEFTFANETRRSEVPRALAIQRTNLQISYQCLRMVILRKLPSYFHNPLMDSLSTYGPSSPYGSSEGSQDTDTPSYILEALHIAEDMLFVIHTSSLELIRLNGEACAEKIRLVGASILELIARNPSSPLINAARKYSNLYPHILALLDSKASESVEYQTSRWGGEC